MKTTLMILITSILTQNFVLSRFLGICPFLGVSGKLKTAANMSIAVTLVTLLATAVCHPINTLLLVPNRLEYLQTILFILVIAALVQLLEIFLKKMMPPVYQSLGIYLPLITTNCIVLGVVLINVQQSYSLFHALTNSFGAGMGFLLAMVLFAGIREKLECCDIPEGLKGLPITLIAASIVSLSFLGFAGMAEGIFG